MRRSAKAILIIVVLVVAALTAAASCFLYSFYVPDEQAEVQGNIRYTDAEIRRMAMPGFKEHNSLYLRFFHNTIKLDEVPFIDSIEVEYLGPDRVRLHANEEYPVGYLLQDGYRYYFNSSGVVTESLEDTALRQEEENAKEKEAQEAGLIEAVAREAGPDEAGANEAGPNEAETNEAEANGAEPIKAEPVETKKTDTSFRPALADVSQVSGLTDESYAIGEQIQTRNMSIFQTLMTLEKLVNKLDIRPDEIKIRKDQTLMLRYEEVLVWIGTDTLLDEKMSRTAAILPQLEGMRGILHLESFSRSTINIIFGTDEEEPADEEVQEEIPAETSESAEESGITDEAAGAEETGITDETAGTEETGITDETAGTEEPGITDEAAGTEKPGITDETAGTETPQTEEILWDETWDAAFGV